MEEEKQAETNNYYETVIKKTKTGITFPKELREDLFNPDEEVFFKFIVPPKKDKIILKFISKEDAEQYSNNIKKEESKKKNSEPGQKKTLKQKKSDDFEPKWSKYFLYDFSNKDKVRPILESAFYKFAEGPENFDDAIGRVKYALVSFLTSTKTDNAKLFYSVIRFLIDVIKKSNQPKLLDWIYEKVIPMIESKFLYELALIDTLQVSIKMGRFDRMESSVNEILNSIEKYDLSESYNIMNSFKQLVKKVKNFHNILESVSIFNLIKEVLVNYFNKFENVDYKIQIIELLEDLGFIEEAYKFADNLVKSLEPESVMIAEVRKIRTRLKKEPI